MNQKNDMAELDKMDAETRQPATEGTGAEIAPLQYSYETIQINKELVRKYICKGGTDDDIFWFMGKCRALNLDPLKGEVYFMKIAGEPGQTIVGYRKYLDVAYANGLEHIEYEFDDPDDPKVCKITLTIKDRERPHVWETWLEDCIKRRKSDNKPNRFWETMLRDMFRKCAVTRALRYAGLETQHLPYIAEELGGGFENPALQAYNEPPLEASEPAQEIPEVASVTVDSGEDLTALRESYFGMIKDLFANEDDRHSWQLQNTGEASVTKWKAPHYAKAFSAIHKMPFASLKASKRAEAHKPKQEPEEETKGKSGRFDLELEQLKAAFAELGATVFAGIQDRDAFCKTVAEKLIGAWTVEDYQKALKVLGDVVDTGKDEDSDPELEALRSTFMELGATCFAGIQERDVWILEHFPDDTDLSKWMAEQFQKAILLIQAEFPEPVTKDGTPVEDAVKDAVKTGTEETAQELRAEIDAVIESAEKEERNLTKDLLTVCVKKFGTVEKRDAWILENLHKAPADSWTLDDYAEAIVRIRRLPDFDPDAKPDEENPQLDIVDHNPNPVLPGQTEPPDEEQEITKEQFKRLRALATSLPQYKTLGSVAFRVKVKDVIGYKPKRMGMMKLPEAELLLRTLEQELSKHLAPTQNQKEEQEALNDAPK